jgi:hypothetical protein
MFKKSMKSLTLGAWELKLPLTGRRGCYPSARTVRAGETKSYCHKEPRCVKCAGKHTTESCNKSKEIPSKCFNCRENHPANYRGCVVAKKLQALRNKAANPTKLLPPPGKQVTSTMNGHLPIPHTVGEIKAYADATKVQPHACNINQPQLLT